MEMSAGEFGLGPGIPSFWCVLFIRLLCWTQFPCHLNHTIPTGFRSVCLDLQCLVSNCCCLRMVYARTCGGYKVTQDRSQSKGENDLVFMVPTLCTLAPFLGIKVKEAPC